MSHKNNPESSPLNRIIDTVFSQNRGLICHAKDRVVELLVGASEKGQEEEIKVQYIGGKNDPDGYILSRLHAQQDTPDNQQWYNQEILAAGMKKMENHSSAKMLRELKGIIRSAKKNTSIASVSVAISPDQDIQLGKILQHAGFVRNDAHETTPENNTIRYTHNTYNQEQQIDVWIQAMQQNQLGNELIKNLSKDTLSWLRKILRKSYVQNKDPDIQTLYGVLHDMKTWKIGVFSDGYFSTSQKGKSKDHMCNSLEATRKLHKTHENKILCMRLADGLCREIEMQTLSEDLSKELAEILRKDFKHRGKWDQLIRTWAVKHSLELEKNVIYDYSYLYGLLPENTEPEALGDIVEEKSGNTFILYRLKNRKHLQEESGTLNHCVGESDTYARAMREGNIDIFSLRMKIDNKNGEGVKYTHGKPTWTIEYDCKSKKILQIKTHRNETPQEKDTQLICDMLTRLTAKDMQIVGVNEAMSFDIVRTTKQHNKEESENTGETTKALEPEKKESYVYTSPDENISLDYLRTHPNIEVIRGSIELTEDTTTEDMKILCPIPGLTIDGTDIKQEVKDTINTVKGDLIDTSHTCSYPRLLSVGGYLHAYRARNFSAPVLESVNGHLDANNAQSFSAPALKSVGEYLHAYRARNFSAPVLESVNGHLDASRAQSFSAPVLESVGGYLDAENAQSFSAPTLVSVGEYLDARGAQSFSAPILLVIKDEWYISPTIQKWESPKVESVGGEDIKNWKGYARWQKFHTYLMPNVHTSE